MKWSDARLDRIIERELCEGLPGRVRLRLHDRLRRDPRARARYDRAVEALRVLEGGVDVAPTELDLVGRWLDDEWDEAETADGRVTGWRWWPAMMTVLAAALVVLWVGRLSDSSALRPWTEDDAWQARGAGAHDGLALEALCTADEADPSALRARARECALSDLLSFAYRMPAGIPEDPRGQLTVFGIDAQGDAMFYLPTPVDPAGATVEPGRWRPLSVGVRLSVNHAPGPLRIYGVVAPRVATVDEVRAFVAELAPQPAAAPGDDPWIDRVASRALAGLCPEPSACHAAELAMTLRPTPRTP